MGLSLSDWHQRYLQQATWTRDLRAHLFAQVNLAGARRILEVGCGTGALLGEMQVPPILHGLDLHFAHLQFARQQVSKAHFATGDGHVLPYPSATFDLSFCHFLLLWVSDPLQVLREMARVTRPGGFILALAEPDYGGRIDHPPELAQLGTWQEAALQKQGADPLIGRRLASLFASAGIEKGGFGVVGGEWQLPLAETERQSEWQVLLSDLGEPHQVELQALRRLDDAAWERGERVLYVPTFYAWGCVP